jgi:glycosyltransferase involved in cell wall biosynthesis
MPKIAVIIPAYNRASLIGESIESVLRQTFTDFEIIVVDDGSTDNTKEVVNSYHDPRIRYEYKTNGGVSAARNTGARMTTAAYLTFLDSDDVYLENALEKMVNILDSHPQVGFTYGQAHIMKVGGEVYRVRKSFIHNHTVVIRPEDQIRELVFYKPWNVSTFMVRHSCHDSIDGFNQDLWYGEDYHYFIRLAKRYSAAYIAEPVANVRYHGSQLQNEVKPGRELAFYRILSEVFEDRDFAPHVRDIRGQTYCHIYRTWLVDAAYDLDMKSVRQYLRQAVKFYPQVMFKREILFISYKYFASLLPTRVRIGLRDFKRKFRYSEKEQE